jgi:hypothetical protein
MGNLDMPNHMDSKDICHHLHQFMVAVVTEHLKVQQLFI